MVKSQLTKKPAAGKQAAVMKKPVMRKPAAVKRAAVMKKPILRKESEDSEEEPLWRRSSDIRLGWSHRALLTELAGGLYRCLAAVPDSTICRPEAVFGAARGGGFTLATWREDGQLRAVLQARMPAGGSSTQPLPPDPVYAVDEADLKFIGDYENRGIMEGDGLKLQFHGAIKEVKDGPLRAFDSTCWNWDDDSGDCLIAVDTLKPGIDFAFHPNHNNGITSIETTKAGDLILQLPNSDWRNAYFFRRVEGVTVNAGNVKSLMSDEAQRNGRNCD